MTMSSNVDGGSRVAWARVRLPLTLVARFLLGLVFALSAASKVTAPGPFRADVAAYGLLPYDLVSPFAAALPWIEALVALYLLVGLFLRPTAIVTALLLVMFTGALIISLINGNTAHGCGCFSTSGPLGSLAPVQWLAGGARITPFDVARDIVFILLAAAIYWGDRYAFSLDGLFFKPLADDDDDESDEMMRPVAVSVAAGTKATMPARNATNAASAKRQAVATRGARKGRR